MSQVWRVAWYRFRATLPRRFGGLVAIVLLVGLVGGLALGAIGGARRTQSSFPALLRRTNASNLSVGTGLVDTSIPGYRDLSDALDVGTAAAISRLPYVVQVGDFTGIDPNIVPIGKVAGNTQAGESPPAVGGSVDGEYSKLDRLTLASGRMADPRRLDEVVMTASASRELGVRVGGVFPIAIFTNAQLQSPGCCSVTGTGKLAPHLTVALKLVGIVVVNANLVADDVDQLEGSGMVLLTPALTRQLVRCCAFHTFTSIKVAGGSRNVPAVQAEITRAEPKLKVLQAVAASALPSTGVAKAERAIEPESIALGVFGAIAAVAMLLIGGQLIGRQLRRDTDEHGVLRALGRPRRRSCLKVCSERSARSSPARCSRSSWQSRSRR